MPKGWFFEIHEDTPEQEAANLMEHSASVLDISSDDDFETKKRNEDLERGKENIPPPDFLMNQPRIQVSADVMETGLETDSLVQEPVKRPRLRTFVQDAMDEDRKPLGDLQPSEFYGEGCDASSYVTVDLGIEKPSGLSKEINLSSSEPEEEQKANQVVEVEVEPVPAPAEQVEVATKDVKLPAADLLTTASPLENIEAMPAVEAPAQEEALIAPVAAS